MERITNIKLPEDLLNHFGKQNPLSVRSGEPFKVSSFSDLVKWSAQVSCLNPEVTILYRGQNDEKNENADKTLLLPSLYRWRNRQKPTDEEVQKRANQLNKTCEKLIEVAQSMVDEGLNPNDINFDQLKKRPSLQWGVLQHYGYCSTPYLDVTQSLRMACMFALDGAEVASRPCVYMLGMPYITDKFFRDSGSELMVVRLLSAMPPVAKRAYFQEGYLVGSEFDLKKYSSKHDVAQRLLAKFELIGDKGDWISQVSTFSRSDIYSEDVFSKMKEKVVAELSIVDSQRSGSKNYEHPDRFPSLVK